MMDEAQLEPLYSPEIIARRLDSLAGEISACMPRDFVLISILKGSFVFAADLVRSLVAEGVNPEVDFMILSSYGGETSSRGVVNLLRDTELDIKDRHVLLVDDILDSGKTLDFARRHLQEKGAKSTRVCVLLDKATSADRNKLSADFVGFSCPDAFVVGYGMDYAHKFRGLPFIAILCQ
jgi:hypoxanthine phosphoribosyltransferase